MDKKRGSVDKLIDMICELRLAPVTVHDLGASVGVVRNTARLNVNKLVKAGLVEFHSFDMDGKHGCRGQKPVKWTWK